MAILSNEEIAIHNSAYESMQKIIDISIGEGEAIDKALHNTGFQDITDPVVFLEIADQYRKTYSKLQAISEFLGQATNHQLITMEAFSLLGDAPNLTAIKDQVIRHCSGPDKALKTQALMMEGHFYGPIGDDQIGNYLPKYFGKNMLHLMKHTDDIEETAHSNAAKYYDEYKQNKTNIKSLGWALHYLQDMTSPPHAANIPSFFPKLHNQSDIHCAFETLAHKRLLHQASIYTQSAKNILTTLAANNLDIKTEGDFVKFRNIVYKQSFGNVNPDLYTQDESKWDLILSSALPLAIAVSAYFLEKGV